MTIDPTYNEQNGAATKRMRALAGRLSDEQMQTKVGEHWTVSIMFAHLAWWDQRVLYVLEMTEKNNALFAPEIDTLINDLSLPLWAAVPPHEAARIALETADKLDARLEGYSPILLEAIFQHNKRWVVRALHRNEHLDEAENALNG